MLVGPLSLGTKVSFSPVLVFKYGPSLQAARIVGAGLYQVNTKKTIFYNFRILFFLVELTKTQANQQLGGFPSFVEADIKKT
jgi:hypothetical protein